VIDQVCLVLTTAEDVQGNSCCLMMQWQVVAGKKPGTG
jgi:hypothetical protein